MGWRRGLGVAAVIATGSIAASYNGRVTTPAAVAREADEASVGGCGTYRWDVKTGQDAAGAAAVDLTPSAIRQTTVGALRRLHRPAGVGSTRAPRAGAERRAYLVNAYLEAARWEADGDYHVVIRSRPHGGNRLITEIPDPRCLASLGPASVWTPFVTAARTAFTAACGTPPRAPKHFATLSGRVRITGVAYFDPPNHGNGSAPNGVELHPVLGFQLLTATCGRG